MYCYLSIWLDLFDQFNRNLFSRRKYIFVTQICATRNYKKIGLNFTEIRLSRVKI